MQRTHQSVSPSPSAPCCLILSPHPDDESIVGGLALRLQREAGWRVVNLAITHGSNTLRQLERAQELQAACQVLNFECRLLSQRGLTGINLATRQAEPTRWQRSVDQVQAVISELRPQLLLFPHADDAQSTHIGTHWLARDALSAMPSDFQPTIALSEYWSTMSAPACAPNLMLELSTRDVASLLEALMQHQGEIARNPYHLSLPAWMIDNVRRGAEQVGAAGASAPPFRYACLYHLCRRDSMERLSPQTAASVFCSQHTLAPFMDAMKRTAIGPFIGAAT